MASSQQLLPPPFKWIAIPHPAARYAISKYPVTNA
jgi:hypothetical protein